MPKEKAAGYKISGHADHFFGNLGEMGLSLNDKQ